MKTDSPGDLFSTLPGVNHPDRPRGGTNRAALNRRSTAWLVSRSVAAESLEQWMEGGRSRSHVCRKRRARECARVKGRTGCGIPWPARGTAVSLPEPSSVLILLLGGGSGIRRRRASFGLFRDGFLRADAVYSDFEFRGTRRLPALDLIV